MLIDKEDLNFIEGRTTWINKDGYIELKYNDKKKLLHRLIMGEPEGIEIDHRNRNKLDNRRFNLREATHSQNIANRPRINKQEGQSPYKGVFIENRTVAGKYKYTYYTAKLRKNGEIYKKTFKNEIDAAKWYDTMALQLHGEFAYLNFPQS